MCGKTCQVVRWKMLSDFMKIYNFVIIKNNEKKI